VTPDKWVDGRPPPGTRATEYRFEYYVGISIRAKGGTGVLPLPFIDEGSRLRCEGSALMEFRRAVPVACSAARQAL
jgi:hypothetical protein